MSADKYTGNDNYGKPKSDYLAKLAEMEDSALLEETENKIWLSAYAANNPRSDYHWHCDACYDECEILEKLDIYDWAHKLATASVGKTPWPRA